MTTAGSVLAANAEMRRWRLVPEEAKPDALGGTDIWTDLTELTCGRCRSSPASRLVVVDLPRQIRNRMLRCMPCAVTDLGDAARLGWPAWQFGLIPVDEAVVSAGKLMSNDAGPYILAALTGRDSTDG